VSELACEQAVILAGGRGTRLAAVLSNSPKADGASARHAVARPPDRAPRRPGYP
jgi:hypothetical protein